DGDVDGRAAAGPFLDPESEQDAEGRVHAGGHVGDGDTAAHPVPARLAGDADDPALGLEEEVERGPVAIGPILAEAGDRAVDDAGVAITGRLVSQAEPGEGTHAVVLQHDVAPLDEPEEQLLAPRVLEVYLDPLLVAMQAHEVRGLAARQARTPGAGA